MKKRKKRIAFLSKSVIITHYAFLLLICFSKALFVPNLFCEGSFRSKFILRRCLGVQNLFCEGALECKIYFAKVPWSAKFILRRCLGVQNLFCEGSFRSKFILRRRSVLYLIGKRYNIFQKAKAQTKMGLRKINFALQLQNKFCTPIVK